MRPKNLIFLSLFGKSKFLTKMAAFLAIIGTVTMLGGGIWDAASHSLEEPEYFWSIQHVAVYSGVSMIASAGIVGAILLRINRDNLPSLISKGFKIIILGSILQIASGYGDSLSHDVFGIDGLVSFTHQPLEAGLVLSVFGGFLIIKSLDGSWLQKMLPLSIITLILSIMWICFNLLLLVGGPVLCILVYQLFSSGCAIL